MTNKKDAISFIVDSVNSSDKPNILFDFSSNESIDQNETLHLNTIGRDLTKLGYQSKVVKIPGQGMGILVQTKKVEMPVFVSQLATKVAMASPNDQKYRAEFSRSSQIEWIEYKNKSQNLFIKFKNAGLYRYENITKEMYSEMKAMENNSEASIGS